MSNKKRYVFRVCVVLAVILTVCAFLFSVGCSKVPSAEAPEGGGTPSGGGGESDLSFEAYGRITEWSTYAKGEMLTDTLYSRGRRSFPSVWILSLNNG